ncbi:MAG: helix-turn-helix domain-containing protein [Verrucomicrobiales bacterium]
MNKSLLLTKLQAAEYLGIAPRTIDDWRAAGSITCIQRAGYVRFLKDDLDDFLRRHRREAQEATPYRPRRRRISQNPDKE